MRKLLFGLIFLIPFFSSAQAPGEDLWWEGQVYESVTIGNQIWLARNLDVGHSMNPLQLDNGLIEKFCYNWDSTYCDIYGALYFIDEAMEWNNNSDRGLCPSGFHIPNNTEWFTLFNNYPSASSNQYLTAPPFNGLLGGYGNHLGGSYQMGVYGIYHSSSTVGNYGYRAALRNTSNAQVQLSENNASYYIRCLRDNMTDTISPNLVIIGRDPTCYGYSDGILDLKISGFTNPTILWNTGDTIEDLINIPSGTYYVTVSQSSLQMFISYIVEDPIPVAANINITSDITCKNGNDGSINVTTSNGTTPYTYEWNNGANNTILNAISAGIYSITVTDYLGCSNSDTLLLEDGIASFDITANISSVTCNEGLDGSINLSVTPTGNYTYWWSNGLPYEDISGLHAGTFVVTVTSGNECIRGTYNVTEPTEISITYETIAASTSTSNNGEIDLTVTGGMSPYTYLWSTGDTTEDIIGLSPNYYSVTVIDSNSCGKIQSFINIISEEISLVYLWTDPASAYGTYDGYIYIMLNTSTNNTFILYPDSIIYNTNFMFGLPAGTYSILAENEFGNTLYVDSIVIGYETNTQDLIFDAGWSMFSTYIYKEAIDSMVTDSVIIVKDDQGGVYWPEWNVNQIDSIRIGTGYAVKYPYNDSLHLEGTLIPYDYPIAIPEGWSMFGYLLPSSTLLTDALYDIDPGIIIVKDDQGGVYWPIWGVNQIETLSPGEGYQIKMNYNDTLIYDITLNAIKNMDIKEKTIGYEHNMTICFPETSWTTPIEYGMVVEVLDEEESLVGSGIYRDENLVFSIFGGINQFKFNVKVDGKPAELTWVTGDDKYGVDKLTVAESVKIKGEDFKCFPNPFRSTTEITYTLTEESHVTLILYDLQGKKLSTLFDGERSEGTHSTIFSRHGHKLNKLKPGIYLCELVAEGKSKVIRLNIL